MTKTTMFGITFKLLAAALLIGISGCSIIDKTEEGRRNAATEFSDLIQDYDRWSIECDKDLTLKAGGRSTDRMNKLCAEIKLIKKLPVGNNTTFEDIVSKAKYCTKKNWNEAFDVDSDREYDIPSETSGLIMFTCVTAFTRNEVKQYIDNRVLSDMDVLELSGLLPLEKEALGVINILEMDTYLDEHEKVIVLEDANKTIKRIEKDKKAIKNLAQKFNDYLIKEDLDKKIYSISHANFKIEGDNASLIDSGFFVNSLIGIDGKNTMNFPATIESRKAILEYSFQKNMGVGISKYAFAFWDWFEEECSKDNCGVSEESIIYGNDMASDLASTDFSESFE